MRTNVFLMERAMSKANLHPPLHVAANGQDAIDYLMGNGPYVDRAAHPLPHCIFLDLKLPFLDGFEVLEWLRQQPSLAHVGVLVLSSSPEERDRERALQLGAKAYLVKPPTPTMFLEALQAIPECIAACVPVADVVA